MKNIKAKIPVLIFEEGNNVIAYSPALDLSSCGDTEEQARSRFAEAADIFLSEATTMGTLNEILEENGWRKSGGEWYPPAYKSTEETINIPAGG